MSNEPDLGAAGNATSAHRNEWATFLALAFLGLPAVMALAITVYGFAVWALQILVFGPPS